MDPSDKEKDMPPRIWPRVLIVIHRFHPIIGGAENQALRLSRALLKMGASVEVLTGRPPGLPSHEEVEGIRIRRLEWLEAFRLGKAKFHLLNLAIIREMVSRAREFDVVHSQQAMPAALGALLGARTLGKPCVVRVASGGAGFDLWKLRNIMPSGHLMAKYLCRHADRFVAISRAIRQDLIEYGVSPDRIADMMNNAPALRRRLAVGVDALGGRFQSYCGILKKEFAVLREMGVPSSPAL